MTPAEITDSEFFLYGPSGTFPIPEALRANRVNAPEMIAQTPTCGCFSFRWAATAWNSFSKRISDLGKRILSPLTKTPPIPPLEIPERVEKYSISELNTTSLKRSSGHPDFICGFMMDFVRSKKELAHPLKINGKKADRENILYFLKQCNMVPDPTGDPTLRDPKVVFQYLLGPNIFITDTEGVNNALTAAGHKEESTEKEQFMQILNNHGSQKVDVVYDNPAKEIVINLEFKMANNKNKYLVKQTLTILAPPRLC